MPSRLSSRPEEARKRVLRAVSESAFQQRVLDAMRALGWAFMHVKPSRLPGRSGEVHLTAYLVHPSAGWPDVVAIRGPRLIAVELKAERGTPTREQLAWLQRFRDSGHEAFVWRPSDWPAVEEELRRWE